MHKITISSIPLIWLEAEKTQPNHLFGKKLVIWLPGFSGTKEVMEPYLTDLAGAGFVALSFDPVQHGERMTETKEELGTRVRGNIRRHFWPILAQTAEEIPLIIDWAIEHLGVDDEVGVGGISMGGDIAVTAAGVDRRVGAVAAGIATPDWLRPGSFEAPGQPDEIAQACYDRRNPLTHLNAYAHCPAITFQNGADDQQVPPDGSLRFVRALRQDLYAANPDRLDVCLHPGVAHSFPMQSWANCLSWFKKHLFVKA